MIHVRSNRCARIMYVYTIGSCRPYHSIDLAALVVSWASRWLLTVTEVLEGLCLPNLYFHSGSMFSRNLHTHVIDQWSCAEWQFDILCEQTSALRIIIYLLSIWVRIHIYMLYWVTSVWITAARNVASLKCYDRYNRKWYDEYIYIYI